MKGDELKALIVWVWSSFQLGGVSLTSEKVEDEASKIMARVEKNEDGRLSFDEFEEYFRRTCKSTQKFRESKPPSHPPQSPQRLINRSEEPAAPCLMPLQRRPPRRRLATQKRRRPAMRRPRSRQMEIPA